MIFEGCKIVVRLASIAPLEAELLFRTFLVQGSSNFYVRHGHFDSHKVGLCEGATRSQGLGAWRRTQSRAAFAAAMTSCYTLHGSTCMLTSGRNRCKEDGLFGGMAVSSLLGA